MRRAELASLAASPFYRALSDPQTQPRGARECDEVKASLKWKIKCCNIYFFLKKKRGSEAKASLNRTSAPFSFVALQTSCFHQVQAMDRSKKKTPVPKQQKLPIVQICTLLQLQALTHYALKPKTSTSKGRKRHDSGFTDIATSLIHARYHRALQFLAGVQDFS